MFSSMLADALLNRSWHGGKFNGKIPTDRSVGRFAQANSLEMQSSAFLRGRTLDELIAEQEPPIITNLGALAADFWPEDESADDINAYLEQQRRKKLV